jgi:hypothetical protein
MSSGHVTRSQGPDNAFLLELQQGITKMMVEAASTSPLPLLHRADELI